MKWHQRMDSSPSSKAQPPTFFAFNDSMRCIPLASHVALELMNVLRPRFRCILFQAYSSRCFISHFCDIVMLLYFLWIIWHPINHRSPCWFVGVRIHCIFDPRAHQHIPNVPIQTQILLRKPNAYASEAMKKSLNRLKGAFPLQFPEEQRIHSKS